MLAQAPGVTHLLCIPFGPSGSSNSGEQGSPACQHHAGSPGSGTGALLFGFATAPQLTDQRKAALALLAHCLPAPMARLSGDTLAFVNFATGSSTQCTCCCSSEEEEEEEEGAGPSEGCVPPTRPNGHGDGGAAPSQALRVSQPSDDSPGPSYVHGDGTVQEKLAAAAAAGGSAQREECAQLDEPKLSLQLSSPRLSGSDDLSSGPPSPCSSLRFSKALVRAAEEQGEAVTQQSPLTLTFRSPLAEAEYGRWAASLYRKVSCHAWTLLSGAPPLGVCTALLRWRAGLTVAGGAGCEPATSCCTGLLACLAQVGMLTPVRRVISSSHCCCCRPWPSLHLCG